ncbi:MAG: NAD(P)H-dependent oxidoreductase [Gammaproteobacteria bacterium]|nr:NAD(P)H-dependent oxidoreductase [Gammaproteobacteria bacterium]
MSEKTANIAVLFAHPAIHRSRVNKVLFEHIRNLPGVTARDLYELYPDFNIDVETEQEILVQADLLVFQHPVYWYSVPAIVKEWMDVVLTRGFAYGAGGDALQGKDIQLVLSTGGSRQAYSGSGQHGYPLDELLRPLQQTARFCGMNFLTPLVIYAGRSASDEQLREHAQHYGELLLDYYTRER